MSIKKATSALFIACLVWCGAVAASSTPTDQVRVVADEVLAVLKDRSLDGNGRRQKIRETIAPHFDFRAMSQSTLAVSWKKATPEQQERFVELFKRILENVYIVAMEEYSGETVKYGREKVADNRASVETFIVRPNGVETPVIYRMRLKENQWLAYDVIVEGVSLVSNYRSTFRRIADKEGIDVLLERMQEKVDGQLQAGA